MFQYILILTISRVFVFWVYQGRLSRALNVMLGPTPVAHPALPGKAAPGQLSALEIEKVRTTLGLEANPFQVAEARSSNSPLP